MKFISVLSLTVLSLASYAESEIIVYETASEEKVPEVTRPITENVSINESLILGNVVEGTVKKRIRILAGKDHVQSSDCTIFVNDAPLVDSYISSESFKLKYLADDNSSLVTSGDSVITKITVGQADFTLNGLDMLKSACGHLLDFNIAQDSSLVRMNKNSASSF